MNEDKKCEVCGGETEVEFHFKRRELVCKECGSILDGEAFGEEMEPEEEDLEVME